MARWRLPLLITGTTLAIAAGVSWMLWSDQIQRHFDPDSSRTLEKGDEYVALGDSYTAAPGLGPSVDACEQTTLNYPNRVAAKLGLELIDVSCGGAQTTHVTKAQTVDSIRRPAQAKAVSRSTDLVTISLGGSDFGVLPHVGYGCAALRAEDPTGAPCQDADNAAEDGTFEDQVRTVEKRLVGVIKQVAERAPQARIVVVGYPEAFPKAGPCTQLPLADGDYAYAYRLVQVLVSAQEQAAARSKVEYVDVFAASRGHNMCSDDPWIAGVNPARDDAAPLHPYPEEQQLVADLLVDLLT